jgi:hypothetical protein
MKRYAVVTGLLFAASSAATVAQAAPWERSFALQSFEPAAYYGGKSGNDEKAADCPKGITPGVDVAATVARTPWRTDAEKKLMIDKASQLVTGQGQGGQPPAQGAQAKKGAPAQGAQGQGNPFSEPNRRISMDYRSFAPDINTFYNPMTAQDPGMQEVTGKIAYGFDLDDNPATGGFVTPDGQAGIDNAYYRALGCSYEMRGTKKAAYEVIFSNDHMKDGLYTTVFRVTGTKDPLNDDDVTVEMGYSPDKLVKDSRSDVAPGYSFRLDPASGRVSRFKAKIVNGELTARDLDLSIPDYAYMETLAQVPLVLKRGKIHIKFNADGTAEGMIGGYRKWVDYYLHDAWQQPLLPPAGHEAFFHMDMLAAYYALERNADGLPDPKTGRMTGISAAYSFTAVPAVVLASEAPLGIQYPPINASASRDRGIFMKVYTTGKILRDDEPVIKQAYAEGQRLIGGPDPSPAKPTASGADAKVSDNQDGSSPATPASPVEAKAPADKVATR